MIIIVGPCIITNLCIAAIKNYTTAQDEVHRKQENEALVKCGQSASHDLKRAPRIQIKTNFQDGDSSDDEDEEEEEEEKYDVRSVGSLDDALSLGSVPVTVEQRRKIRDQCGCALLRRKCLTSFRANSPAVCFYGGMKNTWLRHL